MQPINQISKEFDLIKIKGIEQVPAKQRHKTTISNLNRGTTKQKKYPAKQIL